MRKVFTVASREFIAGVRTKSFIVGLILIPVMMFSGVIVQRLTRNLVDTRDRRFAVIDRTAGSTLAAALAERAERRNANELSDGGNGRRIKGRFLFESVPAPADEVATEALRLQLSDRVRSGELYGYFEIGTEAIVSAGPTPPATASSASARLPMEKLVRYVTTRTTDNEPISWTQKQLLELIIARRAIALGVDERRVQAMLIPPAVVPSGLSERDKATGRVVEASAPDSVAAFVLPFGVTLLMFSVVLVGATPLTQGLVEEKQQRIAEVLLASCRPFELMMGKLLGIGAVSLLLMGVYLAGGGLAAKLYHVEHYLRPSLIVGVIGFTVLAVFMFGAIFIAVGAACSQAREIQNLFMPIMLLLITPLMVMPNVITSPAGPLARAMTFVPTAAPIVTATRMALNPAPAAWEIVAAAVVSLAATLVFVWAAGRIFRVGMLMQGKGASLREMGRWLVRG